MKLRAFLTLAIFAVAVPALAAPNCGTFLVVGSQCARVAYFGWGIAGLGTDSIITLYVPTTVTTNLSFQITQLNSSQGSAYAGYFGAMGNINGGTPTVLTVAGASPITGSPGQGANIRILQTCFDQSCTTSAPSGIVPNMFSMQFLILSPNPADLASVPLPILTVRFITNGVVNFEEQEVAAEQSTLTNLYGVISLNEAATPATRYVKTGGAYNLPFTVFSVTNPSLTQPLTGTVTVRDYNDNVVAAGNVGPIPPLGAAGYLLVGGTPGDTLGLFPSSTALPAPTGDGVFHGALKAAFNGSAIFLAQEFNGNAMLNLVIEQ